MTVLYAPPTKIWTRVLKRTAVRDGDCWEWQGCVNSRGYGCVAAGAKGKTVLVHRLAVIVRDGQLADDMTVDHLCHDAYVCKLAAECPHRRCVNPEHLLVCSGADNTRRSNRDRAGHNLPRPSLLASLGRAV